MQRTGESPGLVANDQVLGFLFPARILKFEIKITESMHSRVEAIRMKGLCRQEPDRNQVFTDENPEAASYRASSTEIFAKQNEASLDAIKKIKPYAKARSKNLN